MKKRSSESYKARNKQVSNYAIDETLVAGIVLSGLEVKWVKAAKASLDGSYVRIRGREAWLCKVYFGAGFIDPSHNQENGKVYKLLLHKHELDLLARAEVQKKFIIAQAFFVAHGYVKVSIGIGTVRKKHDKRNALREREMVRSIRHTKSS